MAVKRNLEILKFLYLFIFFISFIPLAGAQTENDTIPPVKDTVTAKINRDTAAIPERRPTPVVRKTLPQKVNPDSITQIDSIISNEISRPPVPDSLLPDFDQKNFFDVFRDFIYRQNFFIGFSTPPFDPQRNLHVFKGKEPLFYYIIFLLLLFGLLKLVFEKYYYDLFRVFFRTTLKQRQIREQLLQSPLPSVFMNGYFVLTAGLYINFMLLHFDFSVHENFWMQYAYCMLGLVGIYSVKYIGLQLTGWLFNVREATDSYTFIVFIINKMVGIFLLPILVLLAFTEGALWQVALVLSWVGIGLLLIYRIILSYTAVRNEIALNPFHFILYLGAFEVIPLLLIYKLLLMVL